MKFSRQSPIFIFPFSRQLTEAEIQTCTTEIEGFLAQWNSHGDAVKASAWWEESQFLMVVADLSVVSPSGCSKDKLYHFIQKLQQTSAPTLAEPGKFFIKQKDRILALSRSEVQVQWNESALTADNQVFPIWIDTLARFESEWKCNLGDLRHVLKLPAETTVGTE